MKKKSPALALLWLLLIPGQIAVAMLLFSAGALIDEFVLFGGAANTPGHPVPVVTLIFSFIAVVASFVVFILAIILTIVRFNKISKNNKMLDNMAYMNNPVNNGGNNYGV
jgi:hypothetical protein